MEEQEIPIPEWQQKIVLEAQKEAEEHPELLRSLEDVFKNLRAVKQFKKSK